MSILDIKNEKGFTTRVLHPKYKSGDVYNSLQTPIYQNVAFEFDSAEDMENAFTGKSAAHTYSRISNPTVQNFENKITEITGALSTTALNSGMAAISNAILEIAYSGANIITSPHLFGNTWSFLKSTIADFNVEIRFCDLTNLKEIEENIDSNTCAIFLEVITNPHLEVADLRSISSIAKTYHVPVLADTTIIPFVNFKAKNFGIDIELVSSTKYLSGGGTSLGGLIIDYGTFDWSYSKRLSEFSRQFGKSAFTAKLKKEIHRNLGSYMAPQSAYMQSLGLETLEVRFQRSSSSCHYLAQKLQHITQIVSVNYTGLNDNPFYELSKAQFGDNPGSMLTFSLSSKSECFEFLNRLKLIKRATNLFDNKSLIIHPASTIYGTFSKQTRLEMGIDDCLIRLSVGLENPDDLLTDIKQALS